MNSQPSSPRSGGDAAPVADSAAAGIARPGCRPGVRGWFNRGRWQIERERCGLSASEPLPPDRDAAQVGGTVNRVLAAMGLESAHLQGRLVEEWPALVGEELARHTRPGAVRHGELTVFVRGAIWYAQLRVHGLFELQRKVVAWAGDGSVRKVVVRPDPEGGAASAPARGSARTYGRRSVGNKEMR